MYTVVQSIFGHTAIYNLGTERVTASWNIRKCHLLHGAVWDNGCYIAPSYQFSTKETLSAVNVSVTRLCCVCVAR